MGFGLSRGFFGAPFRGWGGRVRGVRGGAAGGRGAARGRRPRLRSHGSQIRRAGRVGQGRSRRRRWPKASLEERAPLGDPGSAGIVDGSPLLRAINIVVSLLVRKSSKRAFLRPIQGWPHFLFGRLRPSSSYPGEREAPDHYALFVRAGAKATGPILTAAFQAIARLRRTVTLERFERGVGRSPPDLNVVTTCGERCAAAGARPPVQRAASRTPSGTSPVST